MSRMIRVLLLLAVISAGFRLVPEGGVSAQAPPARALVLLPFATQLGPPDPEVNALRSAGFQVDVVVNTDVTVQTLMSISRYNVVYLHTHSNAYAGEGVVATGQLANDDQALAPLLQDGSVIKVHISTENGQQSQESYYAVTSTFIRKYVGQFPGDSILFVNGCNILPATAFWQALQAKGLGVLVSWDKEATDLDNYLAAAAFFNEMAQGQSVSGAIQAERAAGYGTSSYGGQTATLGYLGDGSVTLQRAAAGLPARPSTAAPSPVSSSTPVSTPVPPTATPTATPLPPTSTPLPPPPLTVNLKHRVTPGTRQVITVRSRPNTTIRIQVVFPSGDTRSATLTTDSSGTARYAFPQHASRITPQHVFASVTVTAESGRAASRVTEQYRVLWSALDVAVLPRQQAAGRPVALWVHSHAHTSVTLSLWFPNGKVLQFHTRTGRRGFARVLYTVGRSLSSGANRTVLVRARARVGQAARNAETTFLIK